MLEPIKNTINSENSESLILGKVQELIGGEVTPIDGPDEELLKRFRTETGISEDIAESFAKKGCDVESLQLSDGTQIHVRGSRRSRAVFMLENDGTVTAVTDENKAKAITKALSQERTRRNEQGGLDPENARVKALVCEDVWGAGLPERPKE